MGAMGKLVERTLDVLAIAAHPDDVEQTCGGTLLKMAEAGYRTGILDLTAGDMGTRGTPETRIEESSGLAPSCARAGGATAVSPMRSSRTRSRTERRWPGTSGGCGQGR